MIFHFNSIRNEARILTHLQSHEGVLQELSWIWKHEYVKVITNYLATGLNFTLSISLSISPVDFCVFNGIFLRSSILCSCKLALLAICGVVGGGSGGGGGGTGKDFSLSITLGRDATDASIKK